jgi:nitrite reductase (NADH) small subunit
MGEHARKDAGHQSREACPELRSGDGNPRNLAGSAASPPTPGRSTSEWIPVCAIDDIPKLGARIVKNGSAEIAVFRGADNRVFAIADRCPHKGGRLSQGIVFADKVSCPLHGWTIDLSDGSAVSPDEGCVKTFGVKVEKGQVLLSIPS